jgi:RNase H-fold protein (predicted Holliday junction resolvase)
MTVIGLDPGTRKCGIAVVTDGTPVLLEVVPLVGFAARLAELAAAYPGAVAAIGEGTNAAVVVADATTLGIPLTLINEHGTTLFARSRYFDDHPPRGWRRFVPRGMLLPPRPIDDYAALLIAERYLAAHVKETGSPQG